MDRSTLRLPDPSAGAPNGERRRTVRQKLHTPVYASFNGPDSGMVVDLSELLDLHEGGFAVQTSERLEMNRAVTLCLDLPETRSFIHGTGEVVWSDDTGRSGIRFSVLPEASRQALKEWLFANLLIASSNHAARTEQLTRRQHEEEENPAEPAAVTPVPNVVLMPDRNGTLSSLETVRREVRELGDDVEAILQLITEYAWELTGASGAALALLTDDKMIWQSGTGDPVPPLGSQVDVKQGLSGECVRSGLLVSCEDMENDPRIDPEIGRALGIGSLMAAPIVTDFRVVGLLEIFSPHLQAFTKAHGLVLDRLVEMVPKTPRETIRSGQVQEESLTEPKSERVSAPISELKSELNHGTPNYGALSHGTLNYGTMTVSEAIASMSPPLASQLTPVEEASVESGSTHAIRATLLELEPEPAVPKGIPEQVSEPHTVPNVPERVPELLAQSVSKLSPRMLQLGLLVVTIVVVAIAIGDLVAPMMEKRLAGSSQASQTSLIKGAEAASPVSLQRTSDHGAADRGSSEQHAPARSFADLEALANRGDAEAQWQLGLRYHNGEGVPRNDTQAMLWFQLAAEQGHVTAQAALGAYYWAGRGVPQDLSKSYFWSEIALAQGDENSKSRLEGLSSQMTQAQVSAARQKAEVWIQAHNLRANSGTN